MLIACVEIFGPVAGVPRSEVLARASAAGIKDIAELDRATVLQPLTWPKTAIARRKRS